jgi:hypothetical protein
VSLQQAQRAQLPAQTSERYRVIDRATERALLIFARASWVTRLDVEDAARALCGRCACDNAVCAYGCPLRIEFVGEQQ